MRPGRPRRRQPPRPRGPGAPAPTRSHRDQLRWRRRRGQPPSPPLVFARLRRSWIVSRRGGAEPRRVRQPADEVVGSSRSMWSARMAAQVVDGGVRPARWAVRCGCGCWA